MTAALGTPLSAQLATLASMPRDPQTTVTAAHISESAMRLDGVLNEPIWRAVKPSSVFTQREPTDGAPATKATDVRMLITDDAVYIGAHLAEDPATFMKGGNDHIDAPGSFRDDYFEVQLDPHPGHLTALALAVSPVGVKESWIMTRDGTRDKNWNVHWDAATHVDKDGWSVEIRIPLSEFHVSPGTEDWGVQFVRFSYARQETDVLSHKNASAARIGAR